MIEVARKDNESVSSLLFRFSKKVRRSGVIMETRKRRFQGRPITRNRRRASAMYKSLKQAEILRTRKLGA